MGAPIDILSRRPDRASAGESAARRSRAVTSALLGSVAVGFLAACGDDDDEMARCVDRRTDQVADVRNCDDDARDGFGGSYFWLFGGFGSNRIGGRASGGQYIDPADRSSLARRGGFGSSGTSGGTGVRSVAGGSGSSGGFGSSGS